MPSTRTRSFIDGSVIEAEVVPTGRHTRDLPPASMELRAPAGVDERSDARRRREHPAKIGRPANAEAMEAVGTVFEAMKEQLSVGETAAAIGAGQDGRRVRDIMKSAKEALQRRVGEYVEVHMVAAKVAALKGDARPSEWALENISVDGERAVDPPQKNAPPPVATFNLGFNIGGMPQRAAIAPTTDK